MLRSLAYTLVVGSLVLTGCGGGSSSTSTATDIEVERGKVYNATVTDAAGNVATQKSGKNIYTFSSTPTYPISVIGGWIDVDGDGEVDTDDVELDVTLQSYTNTVTTVTTYIADVNESVRESRLADLIEKTGKTEDELLEVPSEATTETIAIANSIYSVMKENGTTEIADKLSEVTSKYDDLKSYIETDPSLTTASEIAKFAESKVVSDLVTAGKVTKLDDSQISQYQLIASGAMSKIETAKDMFDKLRTQSMTISDFQDNETLYLQDTFNNVVYDTQFIADLNNFIKFAIENEMTGSIPLGYIDLYGYGYTSNRTLTIEQVNNYIWTYEITEENSDNKWSGTITLPEYDENTDLSSISKLDSSIVGTLPITYTGISSVEEDTQNIDISLSLVKNNSTESTLTINGNINSNGSSIVLSNTVADIISSDIEGSDSQLYVKLTSMDIAVANPYYSINGSLSIDYKYNDKSLSTNGGWLPSDIIFDGDIKQGSSSILNTKLTTTWSDVLTADLSDDNYSPQFKTVLAGTLDIAQSNEVTSELTFESSATQNIFTAKYAYETSLLSLTATFDQEMANGSIKVEEKDSAVSAEVIYVDNGYGDGVIDYSKSFVYQNDSQIGSFEEREGVPVIKYVDGTFESLP